MDRYIGLDVHASSCTMAVVSPTGKRLSWKVIATSGEAIIDAVKQLRGRVHICMEEGTQSTWLFEILEPLVEEVVVVAIEERPQGNKNDTEDSFRLAEMLRTRSYGRSVYKKVGRLRRLRSLVKGYGFLTDDVVRSSNRLKAAYRSEGVVTAGRKVFGKDAKEEWLPKLDSQLHISASVLHDTYAALDGLRTTAERAMMAEARKHTAYKLLQSVPGLGPIRAAQVLSVVVTPHRFRSKRQFWAYCGLAVVTSSSSDWVPQGQGSKKFRRKKVQQTRGLNKNHNHVMKNVFRGAAMSVVLMEDGPLYEAYERLLKNGTKPNLATLTLARKIAATTLAVWKTNQPFDPDRAIKKKSTQREPGGSTPAPTT